MTNDTTAAQRLAAHLRKLEAEAAALDARAAELTAQAAAPLPPAFDEDAGRAELARAQAHDIAHGTATAKVTGNAIDKAREDMTAAREAASDARAKTAVDLAQLQATRETLRVQTDTTRELLDAEVKRIAAGHYHDLHREYVAALDAVIAAAAHVQGAAALLAPPDPYSGALRSIGAAEVVVIEAPAFALGRADSGHLPFPEGMGNGHRGAAAVLSRDHAARLANEAARTLYAEIVGGQA